MDRYLSAGEMAEAIGVSTRTIAYWAQRQIIPGGMKIGRAWLFHQPTVESYLQAKQTPGAVTWPQHTSENPAVSGASTMSIIPSAESESVKLLRAELDAKLRRSQMRRKPEPS